MGELLWSLRDTQCVWCGKPIARAPEEERHAGVECEEPECWCAAWCWGTCGDEDLERTLHDLRALVEAQAAAKEQLEALVNVQDVLIARLRDEWRPLDGVWIHKWEPHPCVMSEPEQIVLYGEVVRTEEADTDAPAAACLACGGSGREYEWVDISADEDYRATYPCSACKGKGALSAPEGTTP